MHPVQPEYGFYTDSACDLSHLVEEYEINAAQETTLYFYRKGTNPDYTDISFEIGNFSLSDKGYVTIGTTAVEIRVPAGKSGTLEAVDGQDETLAEVELTTAGQSTTPTFSLCTLEKGSYKEVGQTIRLASNIQTMTLYMIKNEGKVVEGVSVKWTTQTGAAGAISTTIAADGGIVLTRNSNDAFSGTLTVTKEDNTCQVTIRFDGITQGNQIPGLSYRITDKSGSGLGSYTNAPLKIIYGETVYVSLYCDGAAIKDDDDIDADGVNCNVQSTTGDGVFAIEAEHAESGVLYYTDRTTTYTLQIQIHAPETGFFAIPERNMTYYLEDLNILNSETTVYFFGAKSGDTVSFSVKPYIGATAGALTVSPETITAGSDPIAVTLTDHAASADAYGKKGFRVCVQINGKQADEALQVNRSEDYGKAAAYDFYSYWDGQYRLLKQLSPKETAGGMISAVAYLRRADGTPFTQTELSALNIAFTPNGSSQNAVTLTETLTKDGAIAVTATLDNTYSIEGAIRVRDGAGLELASLWLKYASRIQAYGKVEFEYQNADYSIGFVDGAASGNEEYPEFIRNTWSRNSALNDDTPAVDPFYLAIARNDNGAPAAQPDLYRNLIDSVTFTLLDAGAGTEMPAYHSDKHTKGWDMVTIETYLKNAGSWALQADIAFHQPVWINQRTGGPIQSRNLQLAITFQRTLVPEIRIDLRDKDNLWKDAGGTTFDAMKTVQAYLALLEEESGVGTIRNLWKKSDHADWADMLTNPKAELWFTLPAERYAGDLSAGKLVRQIGLTGTEENGAVTTIQGSVFRTNHSDDGTLALSDLHLQGKGKEEPYFDAAKTRPNYGIYSAGGNIEIEGCTFEDYWAAVWDAPLPDSASKPREMLSLFGGNRNVFRNNRYGVYTDCCRMDDTANRPTIMRSTFEGNTYGIYIQSLLRREGYRYMVKFCKFLDNTCDIYDGDTCRLFFPSNYFGQTQSGQTVSRDPIVEGRRVKVIVDKTIDASGKISYQYADIDTETLLTLDPILLNADFDQSGTLRLGVRTGTSSFSMRNDDAGTMKMDAASLINRASQLMIRMVEQSAASDDSDGADEEASDVPELLDDTTTLGIWNIAAK